MTTSCRMKGTAMGGKPELRDFYGWRDRFLQEEGAVVLDPDGWDRNDPNCLKEKITYEEFKHRAFRSTIMGEIA